MSLPWLCNALVLLAPGYWSLLLNLIIFSKWKNYQFQRNFRSKLKCNFTLWNLKFQLWPMIPSPVWIFVVPLADFQTLAVKVFNQKSCKISYWSLFSGESLGPGCNITDIELPSDSTAIFWKCTQLPSTARHCGGRPLPLGSQIKYSFQQGTTCHHRNRLPLAAFRMWRKRQLQSISDSD